LVDTPEHYEIQRKDGKSHPIQNGRPFADQGSYGRESDMEERHVKIEKVSILDVAPEPLPDHVKMLWFISIKALMENVEDPARCQENEKNSGGGHFDLIRYDEIIRSALNQSGARNLLLRSCTGDARFRHQWRRSLDRRGRRGRRSNESDPAPRAAGTHPHRPLIIRHHLGDSSFATSSSYSFSKSKVALGN